jgi:superfamily II DNA or RNA helicase
MTTHAYTVDDQLVQPKKYELRPYQSQAVDDVFTSWQQFKRLLGVAPTGSGKTITFAEIADQRQVHGRVLILAHRDELIDQAIDKLHQARRLFATKEKAQDRASLEARIVVASVQTLARQNRLERFPIDHFATVIVDEAHHVLADSYQRVLAWFPSAKVLGVTATPDRGDTRSLGTFFEDVAFEINMVDLIRQGYLCRVKVQTVPIQIDISNVSTRAGDFSEEEVAAALEPVLEKIAGAVSMHAKGRKTLIFVPLIRIADQFAEILCRHGFAAESICGVSSDRTKKLIRFSQGETEILVNAMLLTEGYDESSIDCVICLRPTRIRSLYAQMVGRGTRIHPGKENLLLLDFLWLSRAHNLVKPVDLIAHDEDERQAVGKMLEETGGDLVGALDESRERSLAQQVLAHRKLCGEVTDLLDLVDLVIAYKAPELEHYAPTMRWHYDAPSEKQLAYLKRYRVDLGIVQDRGHASASSTPLCGTLRARRPATSRRITCITWAIAAIRSICRSPKPAG